MEISILIRFKNEAKYLDAVLSAVSQQSFPKDQYEIIAIDNYSTDNSLDIASKYTSHLLQTKSYRPGKALNEAIASCRGKYICVLSAHTVPANSQWLQTLYNHMQTPNLAGVYGAQLYPVNSEFLDKRDLDIFSTLTPRIEQHDSDFWNANSMFSREVWEKQPFEDTVFELEDHYWTKVLLPKGYVVHFEPDALVYHYSHIDRLDRTFLPPSDLTEVEQFEQAKNTLCLPELTWPEAMKAGLTMNSLPDLPELIEAVHLLGRQLIHNPDFDVRWRMAQALSKIKTKASVNYLVSALANDPSYYSRDEATWSLAKLGDIAVDAVIDKLPDLSPDHIPFAALALGKSGVTYAEEKAVEIFLKEFDSEDINRRINAVHFAGEIVDASESYRLFKPIFRMLNSDNLRLKMVCAWAIGKFADLPGLITRKDIAKLSKIAISHPDILVRFEALVAFGKWGIENKSMEVFNWLSNRLSREKVGRVRYGAAQCLRLAMETYPELELDLPMNAYNDSDFGVRYEISLINQLNLVPKS